MVTVPVTVKQATALYASVGQALATWATVETDLTLIFYGLSGTKTRQQSAAIMDAIISFETRMDVLGALFALNSRSEMDDELWRKIMERCRKLFKKRHRMAHFRLLAVEGKQGLITAEAAPFFSHEKWLNHQQETLSADQIVEITASFEQMHFALLWVMQQVATGKRRKQHFRPRRGEPPEITRLRALAVQSLQERRQQRPPSPR